jgi:phosphotransferase system enzyme I (PtsP)
MRTYKTEFVKSRGQTPTDKYKGLSLSRGFGVGPVIVHRRRQVVTKILADDKQAELARFTAAHTRMNQDLDDKFNASKLGIGEHADILETYRMLARDKGWYNKIAGHVEAGLTAEAAVERAFEDMWNRLSGTQDVYLKERLHDLRDVADRLLNYLSGDDGNIKSADLKELVIVAQTMGPADLMDYDYHKIRALILEDGTPTMHVAIVAKALGIPAVSKIKGIFKEIHNGEMVAVNGDEGLVYIRPSDKILADFRAKIAAREQQIQQMATLRKLAPRTKDKHRINMYINVGLDFDLEYIDSTNCDGIGLYRTEIPFMAAEKMPDVESQRSHYRKLFDKAGERKVVFRSLDVGSDKLLPYWAYSGEENPAIGWRSIRITLDRRAILRQQMRAFIRAAAGKELNVMFPMIANLAEFRDAKETLMLELEKEKRRSDSIPTKVNVGLMIEVPSVVFQLEAVLKEADFISVGTNDLAQFTFACDRTNNRLADRYDVLSVPFLRILKEIITQADKAKVLCSVCGEMASNPIEAMVLIGLGFRNLSCAGSAFGKVKKMIRSVDTRELADYVSTLLEFNQRTLRPQLIAYAHDHGIEIF